MSFPATFTAAVDGTTEIVADHLNALENKVGIDGSAVVTSLDYLLKSSSSLSPGHHHTNLYTSGGAQALAIDVSGNAVFNYKVGIGMTPTALFSIKTTATYESANLGSELLSSSGWTSTDWSGDWSAGWTHATGNTTALENSLAATSGYYYQISYTVSGRTAGTFVISFGGQTSVNISATGAWGPKATSTDSLIITPTSDFNGTIILSIKVITAGSAPYNISDNTGTASLEIRPCLSTKQNMYLGRYSGAYTTTGSYNVGIGYCSVWKNTTGVYNIGIGANSLRDNTTGYYNLGIGSLSLALNTTGHDNIGIGAYALFSNISGYNNIGAGGNSLYNNTSGCGNVGIGQYALQTNTTGANNVAIGYYAGATASSGSNTSGISSVFIGCYAKPNADGETNQIVIGTSAIGIGSNTVMIGNSSIVTTYLQGNVGIKTSTFGSSAAGVLALANGTAPGSSPTNAFQMYAYDVAAGNSCPHFRTETGDIVKLFKGTALTSPLTTITFTAPGTPDYAVADLTNSSPYGFASQDEGRTVLSVVANLQARVNELEARLQASGQIA